MHAAGRRILIGLLVLVFMVFYVASWHWLYPGEFNVAMRSR